MISSSRESPMCKESLTQTQASRQACFRAREPTKPKLMPRWGLLEGSSELKGSDDVVSTENMRRTNGIFQALVMQRMAEDLA